MDLDLRSAWTLINNLSAEMMKCAVNEDWDELAVLQRRRDKLIQKFFSTTIEINSPIILAQNIQAILDMDKHILELCQTQKDSASEALAGFHAGRRANNAYLDNSV